MDVGQVSIVHVSAYFRAGMACAHLAWTLPDSEPGPQLQPQPDSGSWPQSHLQRAARADLPAQSQSLASRLTLAALGLQHSS